VPNGLDFGSGFSSCDRQIRPRAVAAIEIMAEAKRLLQEAINALN
jgi:hypothetical protein